MIENQKIEFKKRVKDRRLLVQETLSDNKLGEKVSRNLRSST